MSPPRRPARPPHWPPSRSIPPEPRSDALRRHDDRFPPVETVDYDDTQRIAVDVPVNERTPEQAHRVRVLERDRAWVESLERLIVSWAKKILAVVVLAIAGQIAHAIYEWVATVHR